MLLTHSPETPITESTVMIAIKHSGFEPPDGRFLKFLLDQACTLEISDEMLEAAEIPNDLELLLQRRGKEQAISSKVLEKVATQAYCATLVAMLLKHDRSIEITSPVVNAAMSSESGADSFVKDLLEHDPTLGITQENLMRLAESCSRYEEKDKVVNVLSEYRKTKEFTPEVTVAFKNISVRRTREDILLILKHHGLTSPSIDAEIGEVEEDIQSFAKTLATALRR